MNLFCYSIYTLLRITLRCFSQPRENKICWYIVNSLSLELNFKANRFVYRILFLCHVLTLLTFYSSVSVQYNTGAMLYVTASKQTNKHNRVAWLSIYYLHLHRWNNCPCSLSNVVFLLLARSSKKYATPSYSSAL